jgi:hypothetical protein
MTKTKTKTKPSPQPAKVTIPKPDGQAVQEPPSKPVAKKPYRPKWQERREDPVPTYVKSKKRLLFDPGVWAKIIYLRDRGKSEVSGFGISDPDDPFHIVDFKLVLQRCISTFTEFDDKGLANYLQTMVIEQGYHPAQCMRVWIHTHPNMSPSPSSHDEENFKRVNEDSTWGVMCVVSDDSEYARVMVNDLQSGLTAQQELKVAIALDIPFEGVTADDYRDWEDEYIDNVIFSLPESESVSYGCCTYDPRHGWMDEDMDYEDPNDWWIPPESELAGEVIRQTEQAADGFFYVCTERFWFQFSHPDEVNCDVGTTIMNDDDLCRIMPMDWGTVTWNGQEPVMMYRDGHPHDSELLREQEREEQEAVLRELREDEDDGSDAHPKQGHQAESICPARPAS